MKRRKRATGSRKAGKAKCKRGIVVTGSDSFCLETFGHVNTERIDLLEDISVYPLHNKRLDDENNLTLEIKSNIKWLAAEVLGAVVDMSSKDNSEDKKGSHQTELYKQVPATCLPIIYSPVYNITFMGLEKLHPFDAGKWGKVIHFLKEEQFITDDTIVAAREASEEDLLVVHTKRYLSRLKWSLVVATITEIPPLIFLPNFLVQRKVLRPLRTQTGGTIMAGKLAMDRGWAINVGGGFHHCSSDRGGGFCAYADITLAIKFLFQRVEGVSRATIIDLDAHQGNGHERDFLDDRRVYIMDVYNRHIYPGDGFAKRAIKRKVELDWGTEDTEYLQKVELHCEGSLNEIRPDIIVYNAGTDILDGDPLGGLAISPQGIVKRDEIVFSAARRRGIPILMVTSGGYQKKTARIIADSILNLHRQHLIGGEVLEEAGQSMVPVIMSKSVSAGAAFSAI